MQSAGPSSDCQEQDAPLSASTSNIDANPQTQPRKRRLSPKLLFIRASRANSLPDFIEALEIARHQAPAYDSSHPYPSVIRSGLSASIRQGRTSLASYLLGNEPLAPAILRAHIRPSTIGRKASIPLFELLIAQYGWDINTEDVPVHCDKRPLISWVLEGPNEHELICWLLDHNARVDFGQDDYFLERLVPRPPALLETCARYGSVESFRLLQARGARLGNRTLHFACVRAACYGADPSVSSEELEGNGHGGQLGQNATGNTAEFDAYDSFEAEMAAYDAGAEARASVQRPKRAAMLRFLVDEVGLEVNQPDLDVIQLMAWHYGTPICYAAEEKDGAAVVRWVLGKGADPLFQRWTICAEACARAHGNYEVLQVLGQWRELNPEKVQERKALGSAFETPIPSPEWQGKSWKEWEAFHEDLGPST
ncbi:hypothetical protein VPNG_07292 [Cytospora leucostoma]|uniref:Ankyrin repeat protein n=1 Tax=Cytospora leucostoma TaxID=1230097 RepID=A0A423WKH2_9PEZI|nr:hypothetical protein VPNG_07292 [Cytospora leucostoma]